MVQIRDMGGPHGAPMFRFLARFFALDFAIMSLAAFAATSSANAQGVDNTAATDRPAVHVAGPRTGRYAHLTRDIEAGVRAALRHLGVPVANGDAVILTDACGASRQMTKEPAVPVVWPSSKLPAGEVADIEIASDIRDTAVIIGHPCARTALAAAKAYSLRNQLFIAPVTRHSALTDDARHTTVLRLTGRDDGQGTFAGRYLARNFSARDVVAVHDPTRVARRLVSQLVTAWPLLPSRKDAIVDAFANVPRDMPTVIKFTASKASYADLIEKIRLAAPKAVYIAAFPMEAQIIVKDLAAAGLNVQIFGPDTLAVDPARNANAVAHSPSPHLATVKVSLPVDALRLPAGAGLIARLRKENLEPSDAMLRAYAAVELWWAARNVAQTHAGRDLSDAIKSRTTQTSLGPMSFDSNGDLQQPSYAFFEIGEDSYRPLSDVAP